MNKITNQLGENIIAVGSSESLIRMKQLYNLTIDKMIQRIHNSNAWSNVRDSCLHEDLCFIIEDDKIPKYHIKILLTAAKYYAVCVE